MLFIVSLGLTALRGLEVLLHEGMLQELGDVRAVLRILLQYGGDELLEPRAVGIRNGLELALHDVHHQRRQVGRVERVLERHQLVQNASGFPQNNLGFRV